MKSWDLPSEELVAYRYENVTPLFFPSELACCIGARSIYTVTTVVGVKIKKPVVTSPVRIGFNSCAWP